MGEKSANKPKRQSLATKLSQISQAISRSFSSVPKHSSPPPGNDNVAKPTGILEDVKRMGFKDVETLINFLNTAVTGVQDDEKFLLEGVVTLLSKLPSTSAEGKRLGDSFIQTLWKSLEHPPISSLGEDFKYRRPDGSGNNIHMPMLGAANTPYARTVAPLVFQPPNQPDPGVIFDMLMARDGKFKEHPNKISSVLFYMATIIIHDLFQTDPDNYNINLTSSYLDLSPLYGRNWEEQKQMRTFKDGKLKPDCFSSKRILGFPPGTAVLLVMFNRFHNYVVTQLASINENGRFNKPKAGLSKEDEEAAWKKYDHDLFNHGRLITCGLYVNIILRDYVRTILSLNRTSSTWVLDPRWMEHKNIFNEGIPEGVGNVNSVEFNAIYRWHTSISQRDEQWTIDMFKAFLGGKDPEKASLHEILGALNGFEASIPDEPEKRTFGKMKRNPDGTLPDDEMVEIFVSSVEDVAGAFGANNVPNVMKAIEVLGIMQTRAWNLATLNELRKFFGLVKHETFEDINPDPAVAEKLRALYENPDSVELYPGLMAEKAKPVMTPGSGLCVNYTTSRAILSDAVSLVRGDRFFTTDYTPKHLTNWGYNEANYDVTVNQGHAIHKLIFRAFPNHFPYNSIYAHFPFVIPPENKVILDRLCKSDQYSWVRPARKPELVIIKSHKAVTSVLSNQTDFKVIWGDGMVYVSSQPDKTYGQNFALSGDGEANAANRAHIKKALYPELWEEEVRKFYTETTTKLLDKYSYSLGAKSGLREVDLVRDVINLVNVRFQACLISLPIKTDETPRGIYTEQELYLLLTVIFSAIFFDADIANGLKLNTTARELMQQLGSLVQLNAESVAKVGPLADLVARLGGAKSANSTLSQFGNHLIERLMEKGKSIEEVVWNSIMPLAAAAVANQGGVLSQCIDYYLHEGKEHLPRLHELAHANTKEADDLLMR